MKTRTLLCCLLATSCTSPQLYTKADRLTFDAIAPEYRTYVLADPSLDQSQKDLRLLNVETWRIRLEAAEVKK